MQAKSDAQLLADYARHRSEAAFGEIVARYTNLIYSTVLRQAGSAAVAEDVAQSVFADLARKAPALARQLPENGTLVGWLYRGTRFALSKYLRDDHRRQTRESQAMQELYPPTESSPDWERVRPVLDEALAGLNETEREAMLLRFFKNQGFQAIGAALGISDDAAQKRVGRGLEKLRAHLASHGITTTAAVLSAVLSTNAVQSAPAGLAAKLASASLASAGASTGGTLTIMKLLTPLKVSIISAGITLGLAAWLAAEHGSLSTMQQENAALRQQVSQLSQPRAEIQPSAPAKADSNELARLRAEELELLRLRAEVARLRATPPATNQPGPSMAAADLAELAQYRAKAQWTTTLISTVNAMKILGVAITIWADDNGNKLPTDIGQLRDVGASVINWPAGMSTNSVEFMAYDQPLSTKSNPGYPFMRLKQPLQSPDGKWYQVYVLVDGSAQPVSNIDGNFDEAEKRLIANAAAQNAANPQ